MRLLIGLFLFTLLLQGGEKKLLVELSTHDLHTVQTRLIESVPDAIRYFQKQGDTVKVVVLIHGGAYRFFLHDPEHSGYPDDTALLTARPELQRAFEAMEKSFAVRFEACEAGMKRRNISKESLYPFVHTVHSALVSLTHWQSLGYAHVPIP